MVSVDVEDDNDEFRDNELENNRKRDTVSLPDVDNIIIKKKQNDDAKDNDNDSYEDEKDMEIKLALNDPDNEDKERKHSLGRFMVEAAKSASLFDDEASPSNTPSRSRTNSNPTPTHNNNHNAGARLTVNNGNGAPIMLNNLSYTSSKSINATPRDSDNGYVGRFLVTKHPSNASISELSVDAVIGYSEFKESIDKIEQKLDEESQTFENIYDDIKDLKSNQQKRYEMEQTI